MTTNGAAGPGREERRDLADTLGRVGPGVPTLCASWTSTQLLAHLVQRDRLDPADLVGRVPLAALRDWSQRHRERVAARLDYPRAVATLRRGAPVWSPFALPGVDDAVNLLEFTVHHEDVRRGVLGADTAPRVLAPARRLAVWRATRTAARLLLLRAPVGVRLEWPGAPVGPAGADVHRGPTPVVVSGDPVELALVVFGRQRAAQVDWDGPAAAVQALRTMRMGL